MPKYSSSSDASAPITPAKTVDELAQEVLDGKWGNGTDRKERLTAAGYDYSAVQAKVNALVKAKSDSAVFYTVKSGDTLSSIAQKYDTSVSAIQKLNPTLIKNVNLILTGWKIREITEYPICYACECSSECPQAFLFSSAQNGLQSPVETGGGYVMPNENTNVQSGYFTQERIQGDLDYSRAQDVAKKMLDDGLISVAEFNKLTAINRETFSPLFAEIMPEIP